jgi:hypothetical protein
MADRCAAAPAKKTMRQAPQAYSTDDLHFAHRIFRMMMSSSA